jgi:hypothetical protein
VCGEIQGRPQGIPFGISVDQVRDSRVIFKRDLRDTGKGVPGEDLVSVVS